ncbi:MAG: PadR family transcriptional regulator [Vicinamibacterales bacterium]
MSALPGSFEQAVLAAVVHLRGDGYGRTILREVQERLERPTAASAVYATLDRLEAKGLVRCRAGAATPLRGGRPKRHFAITAAGRRALNASRAATEHIWRGLRWPLKGRA